MGFLFDGPVRKGVYEKILLRFGVTLERLPFGLMKTFLDPPQSEEEIQAVMKTDWAKGWGEGILRKVVGMSPEHPDYPKFLESIKRKGAIGMLT